MDSLYIIGITGSYGKTSCAYALHNYFKQLGYESCLMSSNKLDFPNIKNNSWSNQLICKNSADYYLYQAQGSDFLIVEIHEESLKNNFYNDINFDCKVLVNFEEGFNLHRQVDQYVQLKKDFFNSGDCLKVINKNIQCFDDFDTEDAIIFSTKEYDGCDVYPVHQNLTFKQSSYTMMVGEERVEINSYLNGSGYKNILTTVAVLYAMSMFDKDFFLNEYLQNNSSIKGRYELHDYSKNRSVIVDSGNARSLTAFMDETIGIENSNVKGLISVAGGINDELYEAITSEGFVSLNKYRVADPVVRKNCLTFGGNLYKACHKLSVFRDDVAFNEVVNEIGAEAFLDLSENTLILPENIVDEMINACIMLGTDDLTRNPKYCKNFWWRSIPTIKGYFTIHYDSFIQVYNALKSLNNENLSNSCDYVKEMIDYTISQYRKLGDSLQDTNVNKLYLTMSDKNEYGNQLELEMYKAFFKQNVDSYENRQNALKAIVDESSENDILFIAGRGDRNVYKMDDGTFLEFTDSEYIEELFKEVE